MKTPKQSNARGDEEAPILELIQRIKDGRVDPSSLNKTMRQACVEALFLEGWTIPNTAQFLKCCDRTIKRDIEEISERNGITPDSRLATRLIGGYLMKSRVHEAYLMRLARGREGSVGEKGNAEYLGYKVHDETMKRLQTLGYLPNAVQQVAAEVFHHSGDNAQSIKSYAAEIDAIENSLERAGIGGSVSADALREIKEGIRKLTLSKDEKPGDVPQGKGDNGTGN